MAQSRIESDLSNNPVLSKSRIERILNGEEVIPRSRIESLLIGYNPEDPGDYHKVECTKAEYDNMSYHDPDTIYVVTYLDESVHFYLGDTEIAGNPTLIEKSITSNGIYDAEDDSADGYSIVDVDVAQTYSDVSCTMQQYKAMETHDNHTIYTVTDGTETYKFLGDDPIGYQMNRTGWFYNARYDDDLYPQYETNGGLYAITSKMTSLTNPATGTAFDRTKAWDIIACVYLANPLQRTSNANGALFGGGGSWPAFTGYPSAEFQSAGNMFFGISSTGDGWDWSIGTSKSVLDNTLVSGLNWLKFSYDGTNTITISHSTNGRDYSTINTANINIAPTNAPNKSQGMFFGCVCNLHFPQSYNYHMALDECKIYSEGELIFGYDISPKSFT